MVAIIAVPSLGDMTLRHDVMPKLLKCEANGLPPRLVAGFSTPFRAHVISGVRKGGCIMRRRLERLLPIILLALLVQIVAPVGACWAAAIAASDPLHSAVICSPVNEAAPSDSGAAHHHRDGSCSACVNHTGAPVDHPVAALVEPERHAYRVSWQAYQPDAIAARAASHAQARAPPQTS